MKLWYNVKKQKWGWAMILTVDIGNSNIMLGGFEGERLVYVVSISTETNKTSDEYASKILCVLNVHNIKNEPVEGAIISSVVPPLNSVIKEAVKTLWGVVPLVVGPGVKTGINIHCDTPSSVGADLICSCVAVHKLYGGPALIVDVGTATKMTAVNEEGFGQMLADLAAGKYALEARTTLSSVIRRPTGTVAVTPEALNDVVLSRAEGGSAIAVCLELDGCPVARWICDGVILSTPTGSTAYSLSVGGPVVVPSANVTVINVIAPHTLSARPLVVPDTTRVTLRIDDETASAAVYADGIRQAIVCAADRVEVTRSPRPVKIMLPENGNPYLPLSRKLRWGAAFVR
jgi:type III pantothenate kinase